MSAEQKFTEQNYTEFHSSWCNDGIVNALKNENQFQLHISAEPCFETTNDYYEDEYIPTIQDLVVVRRRTT